MLPRPHILLLSPVVPLTTGNGASMRCGMTLEALSRHYSVTLVVASQSEGLSESSLPLSMRACCARVWIRSVPTEASPDSPAAQIRSLPGIIQTTVHMMWPAPLDMCWMPRSWLTELGEWLGGAEFVAVHAFRLSMMQLVSALIDRETPVILDLDDIESKSMLRLAQIQRAQLGRMIFALKQVEAFKTGRAEIRAAGRAARVISCSRADAIELALRLPEDRIAVIPNGIKIPATFAREKGTPLKVLFVGSLDHAPNQDAVAMLTQGLAARISAALPEGAIWRVVGRRPAAGLIDRLEQAGIQLVANAEDLYEHYSWADVAIAPIRCGGGTRIKILEALAFGCPVVSSTIGAEGLLLQPGKEILIADTEEEYVAAFMQLAHDPLLYDSLSALGRKKVEEHYSQDVISEKLLTLHAKVQALSASANWHKGVQSF